MKRQTPTEKQVAALAALETPALVAKAVEAMHALNRRAKEKRDRASMFRRSRFSSSVRDEIDEIYRLKNRFLAALVEQDLAQVFLFTVARHSSPQWECAECGRSWGGDDGECRRCFCYGTQTDPGGPYDERWYVVQHGSFRFHQPDESATAKMADVAVRIEAHSPTQPQREIPKIGLTIDAQLRCVKMATERIMAGTP